MKVSGVQLAKLFLTFILFLCFILHIWGQLRKYFAHKTMTVEEKLPVASTKMAALTICAEQPYKHEGFFFNESLFDEQTCTFQELFHSSTLEQFDEKRFSMSETWSQDLGRCFTLHSDFVFHRGDSLKLWFKEGGPNPLLIVHSKGEEFWVRANNWPDEVEMDAFDEPVNCLLEPKNDLYMTSAGDAQVSCKHWSHRDFFDCAEAEWKQQIQSEDFSCYTVWWKSFFSEGSRECKEPADLNEIIRLSKWLENPKSFPFRFASNPYEFGCPLPCYRTHYGLLCRASLEKNTYHSLEPGHESQRTKWQISLSMKMIEEVEEQILIYDFSAIVAGVGGSLGLFLGFSCLQVLVPFLDKLAKILDRHTE